MDEPEMAKNFMRCTCPSSRVSPASPPQALPPSLNTRLHAAHLPPHSYRHRHGAGLGRLRVLQALADLERHAQPAAPLLRPAIDRPAAQPSPPRTRQQHYEWRIRTLHVAANYPTATQGLEPAQLGARVPARSRLCRLSARAVAVGGGDGQELDGPGNLELHVGAAGAAVRGGQDGAAGSPGGRRAGDCRAKGTERRERVRVGVEWVQESKQWICARCMCI
jgi:hypothetical protein